MNKELWSKAQMELEALLSEQGKLLLVFHEEKCCSGERYDHGTSSDTRAGSYFSHQISSTDQRFVRRESYVDHIPQNKELSAVLIDGFGEGKVCYLNITLCWLQHTDTLLRVILYGVECIGPLTNLPPCNSRQDRGF